ncbi:hypothetical protein AQUCO_00800136v1 [Aquilegia coerulea]|uniref:Malectin-like domain-containing protein n=1 Tax=Aquilegia coerulea TaxID=218851 RepID=A0A2G5EHL6_AQUCA|nr:hypothetical protein AQUCO_00800136v1 [Aquilegia coerulea]
MGEPVISPSNDTLGRSWDADQGYLQNRNFVKMVSNIGAVNYAPGWATSEIAPSAVYGTAAEMNTAEVSNSNFNVTWEFDVHPDFEYLIRFHFCDIVSNALNQLYFNVYLDSQLVSQDFDLTQLTNALATSVYRDYIVKVT